MISRTNIVLAVLLGIVVLLAAVSGVDYSNPNIEVLGGMSMKYSPASTAFEQNAVFPNGMTQQEPVPGTIARGELPLHIAPLPPDVDPKTAPPQDAVPGKELVNPFSLDMLLDEAKVEAQRKEKEATEQEKKAAKKKPQASPAKPNATKDEPAGKTDAKSEASRDGSGVTPDGADAGASAAAAEPVESPETVAQRRFEASVGRGAELFRSFCISCHGPKGMGDGMVAQRGYPPPPAFSVGTSMLWNDGQLFYILTNGRLNMPPFAAQLTRKDRWDVINYVRSLQQQADSTATDSPNPAQTEPKSESQTEPSGKSNDEQADKKPVTKPNREAKTPGV